MWIQGEPIIANTSSRSAGQITFSVYELMFMVSSTEVDKYTLLCTVTSPFRREGRADRIRSQTSKESPKIWKSKDHYWVLKCYPLRNWTAVKLESNWTRSPVPPRSERTIMRDRASFLSRYSASERTNMVQPCPCYQRFSFCHNNILHARGGEGERKRRKIIRVKYI